MKVIEDIAGRYNLSVKEFGKLLYANSESKYFRKQVRFGVDEIIEIDERAGRYNLSRSDYIRRCIEKELLNKSYLNISIKDLRKDTYKEGRNIRTSIHFSDRKMYDEVAEIADRFSVRCSTIIRYFALNCEL